MGESEAATVPGQDYRVRLEAFEGPLDLLLHLVKRHEIDLHDIPIAQLTDQYMAQLAGIDALDVEKAGEFLVMASTLLQIKSAVLMPRPEADEQEQEAGDGEDPTDPRYELVQQLLAYKRYKDAAEALEAQWHEWSQRAAAGAAVPEQRDEQPDEAPLRELELEDVNVVDLQQTFARLLDSVGQRPAGHEVVDDETPLAVHVERLGSRVAEEGRVGLETALAATGNRAEMIGVFLAVLELARQRRIRLRQQADGAPIELEHRPPEERAEPDHEPDWRDPQTGEIEYDWPDEASRKRYERRKRGKGGGKPFGDGDGEAGEDGDGDGAENADAGDDGPVSSP